MEEEVNILIDSNRCHELIRYLLSSEFDEIPSSHHGPWLQDGPSVGPHVGRDGDVGGEPELPVEADHLQLGDDAPDVDEEQQERRGEAVGDLKDTVPCTRPSRNDVRVRMRTEAPKSS